MVRKLGIILFYSLLFWISYRYPSAIMRVAQPVEVKSFSNKALPQQLIIPSINLEENIYPVGLSAENIVDTLAENVGWYKEGVRPGEIGTANLNGHVTNVFANLHKLHVGDVVQIVDNFGKISNFQVRETETVEVNSFSVQKVYGHTDKARLNLVTCAGDFDSSKNDFTKRTIIYSELLN